MAWRAALAAAAAMSLGSGCVAFNVGKPELFTAETPAGIHPVAMSRVVSQTPRPTMDMTEANGHLIARIGLAIDIATVQNQEQSWERVTVSRQKRLAFGLFPAEEFFWSPPEALIPDIRGMDSDTAAIGTLFGMCLYLPWSVLGEPILGSWGCQSHSWRGPNSKWLYERFSASELAKMGIQKDGVHSFLYGFTHFMSPIVGFHRFSTYVVSRPEPLSNRSPCTPLAQTVTRTVQGPFQVELSLPECGYAQVALVPEEETEAHFDLVNVVSDIPVVHGTVRFLPPSGGWDAIRDEEKRGWLVVAAAKAHPVSVRVPVVTGRGEAPVQATMVKEIHHYHEMRVVEERKPEGAPWDIETVEPFRGGRAAYRVTIRDASKTAVEVEREVRPDIERNLRESFFAAMPGMDEGRVRAYAVAEYEGRAIRFRGVAFSVQPLTDGWTYDEETRRGTVRLRISEGMTPDEAKRWARENIEAIVREKNVALEAGAALPAGAVYRSLGETLAGGVLTVEFEAVE